MMYVVVPSFLKFYMLGVLKTPRLDSKIFVFLLKSKNYFPKPFFGR